MLPCQVVISSVQLQCAEVDQPVGNFNPVLKFACNRDSLLEKRHCSFVVALICGKTAYVAQRTDHQFTILISLGDGKAFLIEYFCPAEVTLHTRPVAIQKQCRRQLEMSFHLSQQAHRLLEP